MSQSPDLQPLDVALRALAARTETPGAPSGALAPSVRRRIEASGTQETRHPLRTLAAPALAAAVIALVAFGITLFASGGVRDSVADFFGLKQVQIFTIDPTAEPSPSPAAASPTIQASPTVTPTPTPEPLVGDPVSLEEAQARVEFVIRLPGYPPGIGAPDEVLLQEATEFVGVVLVYERHGLSFSLLQTAATIGKGLFAPAYQQPVSIGGREGIWLEETRVFQYLGPDWRRLEEFSRTTSASALIWEDGGVLFRLEGDLSIGEAVAIAESMLSAPPERGG